MLKAPTIMKQNPLIFAKFEQAFSEVEHDIVNILLHSLQNDLLLSDGSNIDLFNYGKIPDRKVTIRASTFKKLGKFDKGSNKDIFDSLVKIKSTAIKLMNFTDTDGVFVRGLAFSIIDTIRWVDTNSVKDKREQVFEIQFNEMFLKISTKKFNQVVGNFTPLRLNDVSSIKSKYAKKLYEILKAKQYRETSFSLKLEELQDLFNLKDKPLSYISKELNRAKKIVNNFISFEFEIFKKDKLISFKYL